MRRLIFHAVFEATKGLAERLRQLSGARGIDGDELINHCFGAKAGPPVLKINDYQTKSEISEHSGFANLLRGVFGTFRNPTGACTSGNTGVGNHRTRRPRLLLDAVLQHTVTG